MSHKSEAKHTFSSREHVIAYEALWYHLMCSSQRPVVDSTWTRPDLQTRKLRPRISIADFLLWTRHMFQFLKNISFFICLKKGERRERERGRERMTLSCVGLLPLNGHNNQELHLDLPQEWQQPRCLSRHPLSSGTLARIRVGSLAAGTGSSTLL